MSPETIRALEDRVCLAYPKLAGPNAAHAAVRDDRVAYRCPFGHGHWHCEALTLDEMEGMAELLRERHNGVPARSTQAD